jgi:2-hydroxychromene-2-carboxylate isomerase
VNRGPTLFFSLRSPYSWLLVECLLRLMPDAHERLDWVPYWEPDSRTSRELEGRGAVLNYTPMSKAKHLYVLLDTKRLARRLNLEIRWPVDVEPWWEPAHLGWLKARRLGKAADFYRAVVTARWQGAENISDPVVIRVLAESVGLDGDAIAGAVDDPEIRAEGLDALVDAYEDDIFGVPYLRLGWHRFWGFDRLEDFLAEYTATLESATGSRAENPEAGIPDRLKRLVGAYDRDTVGGCG